MQALFDLPSGWFLAAWWLLAIAGGWLSGRLRRRLGLPAARDRPTKHDQPAGPVDPYALACLSSEGLLEVGQAALFSLMHRGIVEVNEHQTLLRGPTPLPDDAPEIERYIYRECARDKAVPALDEAERLARPALIRGLVDRGLHLDPAVDRAARVAQGCVLATIVGIAAVWIATRGSLGARPVVTSAVFVSALLYGWLAWKIVASPGSATRRALAARAKVAAAHELPASLVGWPSADMPASQIPLGVAIWGFELLRRGAFQWHRAKLFGHAPEPSSAPAADFMIRAKVVDEAFTAASPLELAHAHKVAHWVAPIAFVVMVAGWAAILVTTGSAPEPFPAIARGELDDPRQRREDPIIVPGPAGSRPVRKIGPVERGHRPRACDPDAPSDGERPPSLMQILAEHEDKLFPEGPEPKPVTPKTAVADPGEVYAATGTRLYRIDRLEARPQPIEVGPLLVALTVLGPARSLQENMFVQPSVTAIAFDAAGYLWATGDERLYLCRVDNAICLVLGIVPADTQAISFLDVGDGVAPFAVGPGADLRVLHRVAAPRMFGPMGLAAMEKVELCTDEGPMAPPGTRRRVGPALRADGTSVVIVESAAGPALEEIRYGAAPELPARREVSGIDRVRAIVADGDELVAFADDGEILRITADGTVRRVATTGYRWQAAAAYLPDAIRASRPE